MKTPSPACAATGAHAQGAYTLEEFCLSVAAYRTLNVRQCPDLIHHYWSRKQLFRAKIQAWLKKHGSDPLSTQAIADISLVNIQLPRPPLLKRLQCQTLFTLAFTYHRRNTPLLWQQ